MANGGIKKWVSDRIATLGEAVGVRRFTIDGAAAVGLGVVAWLASNWGARPLSTTATWFVWVIIAIGLIAFWLLNYATKLRLEKLPKLKVGFDKKDQTCFHETYVDGNPEAKVIYVAVLPRALSATPVKRCVGYLNSISELGDDEQWHRASFISRRMLEWGTVGFLPVDIDNVTDQALNVFRVFKSNPCIQPIVHQTVYKDVEIFQVRDRKIRRFDIVVIGEGAESTISLKVQLGDNWDDVRVEQYHPPTGPSASLSVSASGEQPS